MCMFGHVGICVHVCVCVCEREREGERELNDKTDYEIEKCNKD